jgi:hypothetical protein
VERTIIPGATIVTEEGSTLRTAKAMGLVFMILMGIFIILSFYSMSLNGRYTAMPLGEPKAHFPILIVDTRTGQVTIKAIISAETPVGEPTSKLRTVVPWSE